MREFKTITGIFTVIIVIYTLVLANLYGTMKDYENQVTALNMQNKYLERLPEWMVSSYIHCLNETDTMTSLRSCTANKILGTEEL